MARTSGQGGSDDRLVAELVTSTQRQAIVWHLIESDGTAGFNALVDVLAEDTERTMAAVRLHHVHLPKLQAAGAVDWNDEAGTVRLTARAKTALSGVADSGLLGRVAGD